MARTQLLPTDADAIGDAISWLIVAEREHPDSPGIVATRQRLAQLLAEADRA